MNKITLRKVLAIFAVIFAIIYYAFYIVGATRISFILILGIRIPIYGIYNMLATYLVVSAFFTHLNYKILVTSAATFAMTSLMSFVAYKHHIQLLFCVMSFARYITLGAMLETLGDKYLNGNKM